MPSCSITGTLRAKCIPDCASYYPEAPVSSAPQRVSPRRRHADGVGVAAAALVAIARCCRPTPMSKPQGNTIGFDLLPTQRSRRTRNSLSTQNHHPNLGTLSTIPPEGHKPSYAGAYGRDIDHKDSATPARRHATASRSPRWMTIPACAQPHTLSSPIRRLGSKLPTICPNTPKAVSPRHSVSEPWGGRLCGRQGLRHGHFSVT
jgi:hypothetical protein